MPGRNSGQKLKTNIQKGMGSIKATSLTISPTNTEVPDVEANQVHEIVEAGLASYRAAIAVFWPTLLRCFWISSRRSMVHEGSPRGRTFSP